MHITPAAYRPIAPPHSPSPPSEEGDAPRPRFHAGHTHLWDRAVSRRTIIRTAAVGSAVVFGSGLLAPDLAAAKHGSTAPRPIPETIFPGAPFHVQPPGSEEPSTITDFNGFIAATEIQGTGTDGLLFDADMRFMQGTYVGVDGKVHHDTFGFVWLDVFVGQFDFNTFSTQIHDFNPGIFPYPDGLFWTVHIPSDAVGIHLGKGSATFEGEHQHVRDFFSIPNSLNNGPSDPAVVSFAVQWHGVKQRRQVNNSDLHVAGLFLDTDATIHWTGRNLATGFTFSSHAAGQQAVSAQIGHERNGVFFD